MSIINKKIKIFGLVLALVAAGLSAEAMSIRVVGGIPIGDYKTMVEEGLRLGNAELLRKAWNHYEKAIKFDDENDFAASSYLELGKIYFYLSLLGCSTEEEFLKAEGYAKLALESFPEDSDAHRALGLIFAGRGKYMDAFEELTLALKLNPTNELVLCDMASLHLALHQPDKSIEYLEGVRSNSGWNQVILAMAYSQKNLDGRALIALNRAERLGYKGYWVDMMRRTLVSKLGINI